MKLSVFSAAMCLTFCASAIAQTTTPPAASTKTVPPAKPVNNNQAATISQRMQANGGSLFRATMEATPEPGQATLREVSFTYVPDPEPRTLKKHDLVTVIVREESAFKTKGTTETKRQADIDAQLNEFIKLSLQNWAVQGGAQGATAPGINATSSRNFKGEGTVDRTDSMTARIAAEVVDVKPNGTLVLQATKKIKTDDEEQQFILTGICRASDVSADNSILSSSLHDFTLEKKHKGAVKDANERNLIQKLLDLINPF